MAPQHQLDHARQQHANERAKNVVRQYCRAHPQSIIQQKISNGTLTSHEAYQLLKEISRDPKTGIDRADLLEVTLQHEMQGAKGHHWPLSLAVVDIDDFKQINAELTHVGADVILRDVAAIQRDIIRANDEVLPGEASVVRWGGEEFVVILVGAGITAAHQIAERLRGAIQQHLAGRRPDGRSITVSIGVAEWNEKQMPVWTDLIKAADERLLAAKKQGKNRVISQ